MMLCYVCEGGQLANGSLQYKGEQILTLLVNVHISHAEFVLIVYDELNVDGYSLKLH